MSPYAPFPTDDLPAFDHTSTVSEAAPPCPDEGLTAGQSVLFETCGPYQQLEVEYDRQHRAVWCYMNPRPRPCFNMELLQELRQYESWVEKICRRASGSPGPGPIAYMVLASRTPGIFNLGGDLELFVRQIEAGNRDGLERYAEACIDVLYRHAVCLGIPDLTTISLVQGNALGGGFETALSGTVLIAEERSRFGLPEILFNLIPGMGALSLLSRKLNRAMAERMILSANTYTATELHEMGLVDVVAPNGEGEAATRAFLRKHMRRSNAHQAMARARVRIGDVSKEELLDITRIWVDAAINLDRKDLRTMRRLVGIQDRRGTEEEVERDAAEG